MNQKILKIAFIAVLGLLILSVVFVEYSTSPQFCNSCHNMEPYYNAWKTSTHNFVPCVDCHYSPGIQDQARSKFEALNQVVSYITRTYGSKPRAEISDYSCLRSECHSQRLLQGRVDFGGIHFDHGPHLVEVRRGLKLRCTSCHSQIVQGTHMTVTTSTCFLCHFKGVPVGESISGCPSCHPPPEATIEFEGVAFNHAEIIERNIRCTKCHVQVVQGQGEVPKERCLICHGEPGRIQRYDDVTLIHGKHVSDHKIDCEECHNAIQHGLVKMASALEVDCATCHPDHHAEVRELYMGIGGRGLPANPSSMFMTRVGCSGCHLVHKDVDGAGEIVVASEASCIHCHGTGFHGMLESWKEEIGDGLRSLSRSLEKAGRILDARRSAPGHGEAVGRLEDARHNLGVVERGDGVHNVKYAIDLLESAFESIGESMRLVGADFSPPRPGIISESGPKKGTCLTCHVGVSSRRLTAFGRDFLHSPHLRAGRDCVDCHERTTPYTSPGVPHGALRIGGEACASCHHSGDTFDCDSCHDDFRGKKIRFRGRIFQHDRHLGAMEIPCGECHGGTRSGSVAVGRDADCQSCHHGRAEASCESCHALQDRFFRGDGTGDVAADPGVMFEMVECADCHAGIEEGHSVARVREACVDCHDEEYGDLLGEWQGQTARALEEAAALLEEAGWRGGASGGAAGGVPPDELKAAAEKVDRVRRDGSLGAHNPDLARALIESAVETIRRHVGERPD
jgi:nitrate/TMAO reductase-like tetraheme cytochrome c subunit